MVMRYALVCGNGATSERVAAYLPSSYRVLAEVTYLGAVAVVIGGRDRGGFTLDNYVIPRLGSGLLGAREIDLSHPVMREVPA